MMYDLSQAAPFDIKATAAPQRPARLGGDGTA
jgi:hypothetical protein